METRKIALACFIGGVLCALVALLCTPSFWWLGMLAGMSGGYITYEFREFLRAIPLAWNKVFGGIVTPVIAYLKAPHPFLVFPLIVTVPCVFIDPLRMRLLPLFMLTKQEATGLSDELAARFVVFLFVGTITWFIFAFCAQVGVGFNAGFTNEPDTEIILRRRIKNERGWDEVTYEKITYGNTFRWCTHGFVRIVTFLCWTMWYYVFLVIGRCAVFLLTELPIFIVGFCAVIFVEIHSRKRVLCAIDGTLGGMTSYLFLAEPSLGPLQKTILVVFGGILGAGFGILNWEIISKRLLKVHLKAV